MDRRLVYFFLMHVCLHTFVTGINCGRKSQCTALRQCAPFMSLIDSLEKPLKRSVVVFLRSRQCGFEDGQPKVCCSPIPGGLKIAETANKTKRPPPSFHVTVSTAPSSATVIPYIANANRKRKIDEFNKAYSDVIGFDLMRRRRSSKSGLEIEIK